MKTIKVSEATGPALDWLVAWCESVSLLNPHNNKWELCWTLLADNSGDYYQPSTNWTQGGPLIDNGDIALSPLPDGSWRAYAPEGTKLVPHGEISTEVFKWNYKQEGHTPLIAAMRCLVCSKLGDVVDVPDELV